MCKGPIKTRSPGTFPKNPGMANPLPYLLGRQVVDSFENPGLQIQRTASPALSAVHVQVSGAFFGIGLKLATH